MAGTPQQALPEKKTPRGNKVAFCIMVGLALIVGLIEWTHGIGGHQQQTAHHSLHSATTGSAN
jgi:hypothetical protein